VAALSRCFPGLNSAAGIRGVSASCNPVQAALHCPGLKITNSISSDLLPEAGENAVSFGTLNSRVASGRYFFFELFFAPFLAAFLAAFFLATVLPPFNKVGQWAVMRCALQRDPLPRATKANRSTSDRTSATHVRRRLQLVSCLRRHSVSYLLLQ
jgi:hypothetical protein